MNQVEKRVWAFLNQNQSVSNDRVQEQISVAEGRNRKYVTGVKCGPRIIR